jgi:ribosomal protein L40E
MVRQVGRPAQRDSEGNIVSKCLVNVTIPTKLRDFLIENKVNRSQLFTQVVTDMFKKELCPKCYSRNVTDSLFAIVCDDCTQIIEYNKCYECDASYQRPTMDKQNNVIEGNRPIAIKGSDRFGCQVCLE